MTSSEVYQRFKDSPAWVEEWNLPLTRHLNPFLYGAYADLRMQIGDGQGISRARWEEYFRACEIKPGLFHRFPGGGGGLTSHDEIMGAAFLSPKNAERIVMYLDQNGGVFNNTDKPTEPLRHNVYRMAWLRPYLVACAGWDLDPYSKLVWCLHILWDAFTGKPKDFGGRNRNHLMIQKMARFPLCRLVGSIWCYVMTKRGIHWRDLPEPGEEKYAVYKDTTPDTWVMPNADGTYLPPEP